MLMMLYSWDTAPYSMDTTVKEGPGKTYFILKVSIMGTEDVVIYYDVKFMQSLPIVQ